jgi:LPS O-antigen subunit length determinant protein (WzzB/FepE family)
MTSTVRQHFDLERLDQLSKDADDDELLEQIVRVSRIPLTKQGVSQTIHEYVDYVKSQIMADPAARDSHSADPEAAVDCYETDPDTT